MSAENLLLNLQKMIFEFCRKLCINSAEKISSSLQKMLGFTTRILIGKLQRLEGYFPPFFVFLFSFIFQLSILEFVTHRCRICRIIAALIPFEQLDAADIWEMNRA